MEVACSPRWWLLLLLHCCGLSIRLKQLVVMARSLLREVVVQRFHPCPQLDAGGVTSASGVH